MNRQEIFDKVANHLLTQNAQAETFVSNESGAVYNICAYRTDDGLKCAVGCLIPDELYSFKLEGIGTVSPDFPKEIFTSIFGENYSELDTYFLRCLQHIHDFHDPSEWKSALKEFSISYNLEWKF